MSGANRTIEKYCDELKMAAAKPLGTDQFLLVSVLPFKPGAYQGQKVSAKGLRDMPPAGEKLQAVEAVQTFAGETFRVKPLMDLREIARQSLDHFLIEKDLETICHRNGFVPDTSSYSNDVDTFNLQSGGAGAHQRPSRGREAHADLAVRRVRDPRLPGALFVVPVADEVQSACDDGAGGAGGDEI